MLNHFDTDRAGIDGPPRLIGDDVDAAATGRLRVNIAVDPTDFDFLSSRDVAGPVKRIGGGRAEQRSGQKHGNERDVHDLSSSLFVSQGLHWVDLGSSARREITRRDGYDAQYQRDCDERKWICRAGFEQQAAQITGQSEGAGEAGG